MSRYPLAMQILKQVQPSTLTWDEVVRQCREEIGILDPTPLCFVPKEGPEKFLWMKLAFYPGHECSYLLPKDKGDSEWITCVRPPERGPVFLPLVPITITHSEHQRSYQIHPPEMLRDGVKDQLERMFQFILDRNLFFGLRRFAFEPDVVPTSKLVAEASNQLHHKRDYKNYRTTGAFRLVTSHEGYRELAHHSTELQYLPMMRDLILRGTQDVIGGWTYMFVSEADMTSTLFLTSPVVTEQWINPTEENPNICPVVEHTLEFSVGLMLSPSDWVTLQQAELVSGSSTPM